MKSLYRLLIRFLLEYASVVWNYYTETDPCQLERVQGRFLS